MSNVRNLYEAVKADTMAWSLEAKVMATAMPKDWRQFHGKTPLHQKINAYLTAQFVLTYVAPLDECERQANAVIQECEKAFNQPPTVWQVGMSAVFMGGCAILGFWAGAMW